MVIEIQGTYWHADPRFYDLDRLNSTQENNVARDKLKTEYITQKRNLKFLEVWEYDIKNNLTEVQETILINLKASILTPNIKKGQVLKELDKDLL